MELTVARRGGDVPDERDVTAGGLPIITLPSVTRNAWLLWRRALTAAEQTGSRMAELDGVKGWHWTGMLVALERQEWPAMITEVEDPRSIAATRVRNALRRYLRESGNIVMDGPSRGLKGTTWFVRAEFSETVPPTWIQTAGGEVTTSWKCPTCHEDYPGRVSLSEHRAKAHPVSAPELTGESFLADVLACIGDDERMANSDLAILLAAGNPEAYGDLGGIIKFGQHMTAAGIPYKQMWMPSAQSVKTGFLRADVVAAIERAEDMEAQAIVTRIHAEQVRQSPAELLTQAVAAILERNGELEGQVRTQAAELERLRREPVSQETINAALEKIVGPLRAERDDLKHKLDAMKKVLGF